jgi:hypothetical protein
MEHWSNKNWKGKTEVLREKPAPTFLFEQLQHELGRNRQVEL